MRRGVQNVVNVCIILFATQIFILIAKGQQLVPPSPSPAPNTSPLPAQPNLLPPAPPNPVAPANPNAAAPKPPLSEEKMAELDRQFDEALQFRHFHPKNVLNLNLIGAVRLAIAQNSDLLLAKDDAKSAWGALLQALGQFDSRVEANASFSRTYLSGSGNQPVTEQELQGINSAALAQILTTLQKNPNLDPQSVVSSAFSAATSQELRKSQDSLDTGLTVSKSFSNGVDFSLSYTPDFQDSNNNGAWPPVQHEINLDIDIPITKYGQAYHNAARMAAQKDYEGALLQVTHSATKASQDTVDAYWKCHAAIEKYNVADRSYRIADSLLSLTNDLAQAQTVTATDVGIARAKKFESASARIQALIAFFDASKQLATKLGLKEAQLRALPFPVDPFPELSNSQLDSLNAGRVIELALARRADRLAALKSIESKRITAEKLRIDMRPTVALSLQGGMSIHDDYYNHTPGATGYTASPTFGGGVVFSWAPPNRKAKGNVIDAEAKLDQSLVNLDELSRSITLNIQDAAETISQLIHKMAEEQEAVQAYTDTLRGMRQKFRLGSATLLDTFQTAVSLDTAENALIDTRDAVAETIASLRFESATILSPDVLANVRPYGMKQEHAAIKAASLETLPTEAELNVMPNAPWSYEQASQPAHTGRSK